MGFSGTASDRFGCAAGEVVDAAEDEVLVARSRRTYWLTSMGSAVVFEVVADDAGADVPVVVAEDAEALGAGEGAKELGAAGGGVEPTESGERAAGDEVAGDEDEIGVRGR